MKTLTQPNYEVRSSKSERMVTRRQGLFQTLKHFAPRSSEFGQASSFELRASNFKTATLALLAVCALSVLPLSAADPAFRAGAVAIDISPLNFPVRIAGGFLEGRGTKITDPLHARCIVLDDGRTKIAFAIVDTCMMTQSLIDEAKQLASAQCGIPVDHMMVSATHTHSAPAAMGCLGTRQDKDYAAWLPAKIAEGIVEASKKLQPAKIGWASIDDWEHTHNRRWIRRPETRIVDPFGNATGLANMHPGYLSADIIGPSGPVDPGLSVLSVQTIEGKPLAVLANYSQHYFGSAAVSADYYGLFCKHVARMLGQEGDGNGPFVCAISQGTSGDAMWMDYGAPKKSFTTDSYAEAVAKYAEQALKQVQYHTSAPLAMVEKKLKLNYRVPDEKRLEWAKPIAARVVDDLAKDKLEVYAKEALILHERQKTEIKLQGIRIGELTIATLPNEVYSLTGLKLKAQSPFSSHFNIELANGAEGYIPTPEQHVLGGYTTWPARTAGLEVQAEPRIVKTLLGALEEATGQKRRVMQDDHGSYAEAVLGAKPTAYWRLNEADGKVALNAVSGGVTAQVSDGAAWYLPGVGSGSGTGVGEKLTPSAFSGPKQINRAIHIAGGEVKAEINGLGDHYSIALWVWLGEASGASERSGTIVAGSGGESLGSQQFKDHRVQLVLDGSVSKTEMRGDDWHFAVLVRDGNEVRVHVDGGEKPEITKALPVQSKGKSLIFGQGLQGKLDEIAVFKRALTPAEIAAFWKVSGIAGQRARDTAERERAGKEAAARSQPPKFPVEYNAAIAAMKPIVHASLDAAPNGMSIEPNVQIAPHTFAAFNSGRIRGKSEKLGPAFSVSLWFRNETPNDASAVTAYLFSRGPNGDKQAPGDHLGIGGTYRSDLKGRLMIFNGNAANQSVAGQTVIPPGTWNHAVFVRDGKHVRAYLNGETKPEIDAEIEATAPGIQEFFLGARSDNFAPLQGHLAQFALFDRALNAEEARQLHTASGQPVGTPKASTPAATLSVAPPLSPADSLKKLHLPAGFKAEIIAAEPLLLDPVAFDWDERGRLWVIEMSDYPLGMDGNGKPGGRVRVLEDSDGDGRYDKSTIFADGLNFPNGILTWRDGVIVTAAPNVLLLKDTDGDGKADKQEVLISGLQEGNQQLRANGLRWGLDNWVYMAIGGHHGKYGAETRLKSLRSGQEILVGARDFRFHPDTGELEPQSGPTQFGRNRDNWGHWFGTQNAHPLWHYILPEQYLRRNPHFGVSETREQLLTPHDSPPVYPASVGTKRYHDFNSIGHFTSACSGLIYRDQLLFGPGSKDAFVCDPMQNLMQHVTYADNGVTFTGKQVFGDGKFDFFASEDPWCRPVMVREGPDGALWVADMYRFMIEHPQWLPKEGKEELLPHYRLGDDKGRIYRVSRNGMSDFKPVRFDNLSVSDLVAALDSTNGWRRDKAHQVLLWRADKAAIAPLLALTEQSKNPLARLHALCVLDGLGELQPATVARALGDDTPGVRENALRLAETHFTPEVLAAAVHLVDDKDAKVRMQLAFSLGASKEAVAGETLGRLLITNADDPMIVDAVMSSAMPHIRALVAAVANKPQSILADTLLTIALGLDDRDAIVPLLSPTFTVAGGRYTSEQLAAFARLHDQLAQSGSTLEKLRTASSNDALAQLLEKATVITAQARSTSADAQAPALERIAATALLSRDPAARAEALPLLTAWLDPKYPADAQAAAIQALTVIAAPEVPASFTRAWSTMSPATQQVTLSAWMSREPWAFDLVQRIERKELPASAVDTTQRARLIKHDSKRISQLAGKVFASTSSARSKVVESYSPALSLKGDPAKGHQTYSLICAVCHKRGVEGRDIGPDLLSVVEHPQEKLLGNILDPSADIQPGFNPYTCTLNTGEQIYGLLASESANSVVMKLVDGTQKTVLRNQIKTLQSQNLSLMPEGLEAAINPQSMADLISFLRTPVTGK